MLKREEKLANKANKSVNTRQRKWPRHRRGVCWERRGLPSIVLGRWGKGSCDDVRGAAQLSWPTQPPHLVGEREVGRWEISRRGDEGWEGAKDWVWQGAAEERRGQERLHPLRSEGKRWSHLHLCHALLYLKVLMPGKAPSCSEANEKKEANWERPKRERQLCRRWAPGNVWLTLQLVFPRWHHVKESSSFSVTE